MSVLRTILSSLAGAAAGGLSGAAFLGIPVYFSNASGFFGPERNWAWLAAIVGLVIGVVPGIVIGFALGLLRLHPFGGAIIGIFVGFLVLVAFLAWGLDPWLDTELFSIVSASIPICGVIGLVIALVNYPRRTESDKPLERNEGRIFGDLTE
jgi:hypothetical protein